MWRREFFFYRGSFLVLLSCVGCFCYLRLSLSYYHVISLDIFVSCTNETIWYLLCTFDFLSSHQGAFHISEIYRSCCNALPACESKCYMKCSYSSVMKVIIRQYLGNTPKEPLVSPNPKSLEPWQETDLISPRFPSPLHSRALCSMPLVRS